MADQIKHGTPAHGDYEHRDLSPSGILYFLLFLTIATAICMFGLKVLYAFLDHRERSSQPAVNPLVTRIPEDTRHVAHGYPQAAFPNPRLEEDERGQLYGFLTDEQKTLYSYGYVDEKMGTVRIPIERAMDLIVQRGLPVRPQSAADDTAAKPEASANQRQNTGTKK